jgi:hypothetical protein
MVKEFILIAFFCLSNLFAYTQNVYVTPYGSHYHKGNCRMVENVSRQIELSNAVKDGYRPCKFCKPAILSNSFNISKNKVRGKSNTVQCQGKTAKGYRCQHMTSIANGYCFQHNPDKNKK